jgi:hypothetical protein
MMSGSMLVLPYAALLSALVAAGAVCWSLMSLRRVRARQDALASELASALRELELVAAISAKAAAQAERVERNSEVLADRVGVLELRGENRPYDQAIQSVRDGADPAKLARQFGLSSNEANLLLLVHGTRSGSA